MRLINLEDGTTLIAAHIHAVSPVEYHGGNSYTINIESKKTYTMEYESREKAESARNILITILGSTEH